MKNPNPKSKANVASFEVTSEDEGTRLDRYLSGRVPELSRNQIQKLNSASAIDVDGTSRPDHYALRAGERVTLRWPGREDAAFDPVAQDIPIRIAYEDDHLVIVNKDAGVVVHPAHGNRDGTVVNALLGRGIALSRLGGGERPGVVHRLDKDTSGLMVVAKTDAAYRGMSELIKARALRKVYHAIIWGNLGTPTRTIDAPIARHPVDRQRMAVVGRGGREAVTEVFVVDSFEYFDYSRIVTQTGRTHQIRVHLAHISHPILGDPVYGGRRTKGLPSNARLRARMAGVLKAMPRHALHASSLSFEHPVTGKNISIRSALPDDMRLVLEMLHCSG